MVREEKRRLSEGEGGQHLGDKPIFCAQPVVLILCLLPEGSFRGGFEEGGTILSLGLLFYGGQRK